MKLRNFALRGATMVAAVMLLLVAPPASPALADSAGPNNAGVGVDVAGVGTIAWKNPGNIAASGVADVRLNNGHSISHYLQGTQYGFAIPAGSTINGIAVIINRYASGTSPDITDYVVSLVRGGAIVGANRASPSVWPTALATSTYGGDTDLWGTTWSVADINATDFGVVLSAQRVGTGGARTAYVDYMQITVNYTLPGTTTSVNCGSGTPVVTYGSSVTCVATVTRLAGTNTPTGTVNWTSNGSGSFTPSPCTLSPGSGGTSTCSITYTPSAVGSGSHLITATYSGDGNFSGSSSTETATVNKATATCSISGYSGVYDAAHHGASGTCTGIGGESAGTLNLGVTYKDVPGGMAHWVFTSNGNYTDQSGDVAITISKANATCSVSGYSGVYDAAAHGASGTCTGIGGESAGTLNLGATYKDVPGGTAHWVFTGNGNYTDQSRDAAIAITPRPVTVTADAKTKPAGAADPPLTYQITSGSLVGTDDFTGDLVREAGEAPGTYVIKQGTLALSSNYTLTYVGANLTITSWLVFLPLILR